MILICHHGIKDNIYSSGINIFLNSHSVSSASCMSHSLAVLCAYVIFLFFFLAVFEVSWAGFFQSWQCVNNAELHFGKRASLKLCFYYSKSRKENVVSILPGLSHSSGLNLPYITSGQKPPPNTALNLSCIY